MCNKIILLLTLLIFYWTFHRNLPLCIFHPALITSENETKLHDLNIDLQTLMIIRWLHVIKKKQKKEWFLKIVT
jgi:hypothetical protein